MKVIGAGLPRTGTLSQKVALEMLGFGPCYHMVNVLTEPAAGAAVGAGDRRRSRLGRGSFGEHESTVDWPGAFFYRELADAYPDAKVVLERPRPGGVGEEHARHDLGRPLRPLGDGPHLEGARARSTPTGSTYIGSDAAGCGPPRASSAAPSC